MDEDVPAVGGERADELGADPFRAAGDDRRARLHIHRAAIAAALCARPAGRATSARPWTTSAALSLADIARLAEASKLPPVEKWNPTHCGDSDDADRPRRHLVPRGQPDRPAGDGAAVLDHLAARARRRLRAGDAGREARHRRRGRAVRRGRGEERGRRARRARSPSASTPATSSIAGPEHRLRFEDEARIPISRSAPGSTRWSRGRSITSWPSSRSPRAPTPPGLWSDGAFFALEPGGMSLAARLREALERGHRRSPILLAGDVLDEEAPATASRRPRCWSRSSTGPSRP